MVRFAVVILMATWWSVSISAQTPVLDAHYEPAGSGGLVVMQSQWLAQTVKFGTSGTLSAVELALVRGGNLPLKDPLLELRSVNPDGSPSIVVQTARVIPAAQVGGFGGFLRVDLADSNIAVQPGGQLALSLRTEEATTGPGSDPFAWIGRAPGAYGDGVGFIQHGFGWTAIGYDFGFRTYVLPVVPEPEPIALSVAAAALLLASRRRGQRP